ncbi:MAG TPA: hypothetical protein VIS75_00200 [Chitinophagaceae bacterium]
MGSNDTPIPKRSISQFLKDNDELLGVIIGIFTSVTFIWKQAGGLKSLENRDFLAIIDLLNIGVLFLALLAIKNVPLTIASKEFQKLSNRLGLKTDSEGVKIQERVNELARQLVYCIRWFAIILGMFYLLQLYGDTTQDPYENLKATINSNSSLLELLANGDAISLSSAEFLGIEIFTNATNLFSASYLFIAFQVLFLVTLQKDNKTWILKSYLPISIAVLLTIANIVFFISGFFDVKLSHISHFIRLLGGIYNGVAMLLLFSRFISMEYFFQNSRQNWQRNFYFFGTIIFLPMYVVAQPLYGLFNAVEIGQSAILFKSIVFLVCFWGKLVFLLFVYTMLNKRWIHAYLFMVVSQKDTLKDISTDLNDVADL